MGGSSSSSALPKIPSLREEPDAGEDSAGENEPVISRRSLKTLEAQAMSRISELEGELSAERQRAKLKEEELEKTQRLLAKLEGVLDQQAKDSQLEQDRLSTLEEALASQRTGTEEKVAKLLLAVAGEKHRAELAEKAREEAAEQAAAEFEARLDAAETLRRKAEEETEECKKQVESLLSARTAETHGQAAPKALEELQQQLSAEQSVRREAENRAVDKEAQLEALRQQLAEKHAKADDDEHSEMTGEMVRDLQQQLATEISKRMDVQQRLLGKDRRLREVQRQLEGEGGGAEESANLREVQRRLSEEESKRQRAEVLCMEKETQLQDLQEQLADELRKRMAAQSQVADKERRLRELQTAIDEDGVTRQQVAQGQVIEKEREVCELQQQLADELSKRQAVQYQIIEKERLICHLQQQLLRTRTTAPPQRRMLGLPISEEFLTDAAIEEEPDNEKPPRSDMRDSPMATSRWMSIPSPVGTASSTDSTYNHHSPVTAPPVPTAGRATWGPSSMQPVQSTTAMASPQTAPRNPHPSSTGAEVNYFIRNCTAPPTTGSSVDVPAGSSGTGFIRNRMYLPRGAAVSGGGTVYSTGSTDTWTTSVPQTWEASGVDVAKTIAAFEMQDKHQRRLLLAARTFT